MKNLKDIALLLVLSLLPACRSEILPDAPADELSVELRLTRAGSVASSTYRMLLYTSATSNTFSVTGTYRDPDTSTDYLTPCTVNSAGEWTSDNTSSGLRASQATFLLAIVSPAVAPATISPGVTGYALQREPVAGETPLMFAPPHSVYVSGLTLGSKYRYTVPDTCILTPRQAKVTFKFTCGQSIDAATVKGLVLKSLIASGWYLPQASRFVPITTEDLTLIDDEITLQKGESHTLDTEYILPMDYSVLDGMGKPLYTVPVLEIMNGDLKVQYPLLFNYKPMHEYSYNFIINSNNIMPTLTVIPWQNGGTTDTDTTPPAPLEKIILPTIQLGAWDNGGSSSDGIGG
jgi:hypothetical protein